MPEGADPRPPVNRPHTRRPAGRHPDRTEQVQTVQATDRQTKKTAGEWKTDRQAIYQDPGQTEKAGIAARQEAGIQYTPVTSNQTDSPDRPEDRRHDHTDRQSITADPKIGDHWAAFFRFEMQFGTTESQATVAAGCSESEPNRGEIWTRVAKHPKNAHEKPASILKKVVVEQAAEERAAERLEAATAGWIQCKQHESEQGRDRP
eukprot:gene28066-31169_t